MGVGGEEAAHGAPNLGYHPSRLLTAHPRIRFFKASEHRSRAGLPVVRSQLGVVRSNTNGQAGAKPALHRIEHTSTMNN